MAKEPVSPRDVARDMSRDVARDERQREEPRAPAIPRRTAAEEENKPTHYRITVKGMVFAHNEMFRPGDRAIVTAEVYNSTVEGKPFKDLCETAEPMVRR